MLLAPALIFGLTALSANAGTIAEDIKADEQRRLNACLERQIDEPEEAYEDGLAWLSEGNRPGARYCTATSLIELGQYVEGADRLEALANAPDGGTLEDRAIYLAQAGNAWLIAGLPEEAINTLTDAIRLNNNSADLYLDRARAYLAQEKWKEGEADLDMVLTMQPHYTEALVLRGEAKLRQNRLDDAMADVVQARAVEEANIDALLLRGRIREAQRIAEEG